MELFGLGGVAIPLSVPDVEGLLAVEHLEDAAVSQPCVQILEGVLEVSGFVQLLPHPRVLHVSGILLHSPRVLVRPLRLCQFLEDGLTSLDTRLDGRMRSLYLQHIDEACTAAYNDTAREN